MNSDSNHASPATADDLRHHLDRQDQTLGGFVKACMAINAGAVIALLGFMQALMSKPDDRHFDAFLLLGVWACALYLVGISCGAYVLWLRVGALESAKIIPAKKAMSCAARCTIAVSFLAFIIGSAAAVWGLALTFA